MVSKRPVHSLPPMCPKLLGFAKSKGDFLCYKGPRGTWHKREMNTITGASTEHPHRTAPSSGGVKRLREGNHGNHQAENAETDDRGVHMCSPAKKSQNTAKILVSILFPIPLIAPDVAGYQVDKRLRWNSNLN